MYGITLMMFIELTTRFIGPTTTYNFYQDFLLRIQLIFFN